eukprot:g7159.t1
MQQSIVSSKYTSFPAMDSPSLLSTSMKPRLNGIAPNRSCRTKPRGIGLKQLPNLRVHRRIASPLVLFALATELKTLRKMPVAPSTPSLIWQQNLTDDFELGEVLGEGQQGIVKEAQCKKTGQKFAVKIMSKVQVKYSSSLVKRMKSEAAFLASSQSCPFAVRLVGAYEDRENIYIVMDCLSGGSLADNLDRVGTLTEQQSAQFMFHVVSFLLHIHSQGVCYGDIKPANFMLTTPVNVLPGVQPIVKAVDFGCCQKVVPGLRFRSKTGTPLYMAPEVHIGNYGVESDIWSAAVMMFQMLSGKLPFVKCDRRGTVREMGAHIGYSFDGEEWKNVSSEAKDLLNKLLVKDKAKRLSASQILEHPWFTKFRTNVSSNIISLRSEKPDEKCAELIA